MNNFPKIFAHRGLKAGAPENTLSAFKMALEHNIDGVEFDVQMTKDKRLVVIHDETVDRTTNGKGFVKDFAYDELLRLDAGSWFSSDFKEEKIPLLTDVLRLFANRDIAINIELKNSFIEYEGMEEAVLKMIKEFAIEDKIIISSFNHYSIKKVRDLDSNINTAILCDDILYQPTDYIKTVGANAVHTNVYTINKAIVEHLHKNGIRIRCYTVNDEFIVNMMTELGVDGIFTDKSDWMIAKKNSI